MYILYLCIYNNGYMYVPEDHLQPEGLYVFSSRNMAAEVSQRLYTENWEETGKQEKTERTGQKNWIHNRMYIV